VSNLPAYNLALSKELELRRRVSRAATSHRKLYGHVPGAPAPNYLLEYHTDESQLFGYGLQGTLLSPISLLVPIELKLWRHVPYQVPLALIWSSEDMSWKLQLPNI
jgi:hypothetical protein